MTETRGKIQLNTFVFLFGVLLVGVATALVKITKDPRFEILWSIVGAIGIGLVALSKYL